MEVILLGDMRYSWSCVCHWEYIGIERLMAYYMEVINFCKAARILSHEVVGPFTPWKADHFVGNWSWHLMAELCHVEPYVDWLPYATCFKPSWGYLGSNQMISDVQIFSNKGVPPNIMCVRGIYNVCRLSCVRSTAMKHPKGLWKVYIAVGMMFAIKSQGERDGDYGRWHWLRIHTIIGWFSMMNIRM